MSRYHGILPVWKPAGFTSHDVVAKVRRIIGERRIGHTGTLDPQVEGVLPLCIGQATRTVEYLQEMPKQYEVVLRCGIATDTEDLMGKVIMETDVPPFTEHTINKIMHSFIGPIEQIPPMYSAVKMNGKRLYHLAREGITIQRPSRTVTIYNIQLINIRYDTVQPDIHFRVTCSKGTYIRTLCVDIGRKLGIPATMAKLVRTLSAGFTSASSFTFTQIEQAIADHSFCSLLIPIEKSLANMPKIEVIDQYVHYAVTGRPIPLEGLHPVPLMGERVRLYHKKGIFIGIFHMPTVQALLYPLKIFVSHL